MTFNEIMMFSTKGDEITKLIGCFVIPVEFSVRDYMMNAYRFHASTYNAFVTVSSERPFPLSTPRRSSIGELNAAGIHWVIFAAPPIRQAISKTFFRAVTTTTMPNLAWLNRVRLATGQTYVFYQCAIFSYISMLFSASNGAKARFSIGPCFMLRSAVKALKGSAFSRIFRWVLSMFKSTLRRTVFATSERLFKLLATSRANAQSALALGKTMTGMGAVDAIGVFGIIKRFIADGTDFHSILVNAISHDVCSQGGTRAAFSQNFMRVSLGHSYIITQNGGAG